MARYQTILTYDGTDFYGFQRQANISRTRTVQAVFEEALCKLGWQARSILAAGRTDTGVHASGQVVAFDLEWAHSVDDLQSALNANLPPDVAVQAVKLVDPEFHPRYDALVRHYQYRIFSQAVRHPLRERYAWRVWPALDLHRLQQAASYLVGIHDFAAFGTPPRAEGTTIREVKQAGWQEYQHDLIFDIQANAFLYRMVRRLVHVQVMIGQARLEPQVVLDYLEDHPKTLVQGLAPPQGLTLVEVVYP